MFCKSCGAKMESNHVVCQMCGTKKGEGKSFCENCGSVRQFGVAFCQECGFKFVDKEPSQPAAQPASPYAQQTPAQQFQSTSAQDQTQYMPEKKFCRSCGAQLMNTDKICSKCGVKVGDGKAFCPHCAAPIASPDAVVCVTCGKSLKETFDAGSYFSKFADNFTGIFKNDIKTVIFDWGSYLASFVIFILSLLPTCYVSVTFFGITNSERFNTWFSPFAGFLFLLSFLVSIARFVPHVDDFIKSNDFLSRFGVFAVPGLSLIALCIVAIGIISGGAAVVATPSASVGFTFWGILLILLVLASVVAAVFSFLRKEGKINF